MDFAGMIDAWFVLCLGLAAVFLVVLILFDKRNLFLLPLLIWPCEDTAFAQNRYEYVDECVEQCETIIPKDLLRAVLWQESGWRQYNKDGTVFRGKAREIGVGQLLPSTVRNRKDWSISQAKKSTFWNVQYAAWHLEEKLDWVALKKNNQKDWKRLHMAVGVLGYSDLELAVRCYNGLTHSTKYVESVRRYWVEKPWREKLK